MKMPAERRFQIVTDISRDGEAIIEDRTIDELLGVLCRRAMRLVRNHDTCERLRPAFRKFVRNIVNYFYEKGALDDYIMTNIMTALVTSDNHGSSSHGVEDYSTFIRRPNPTDPDTDNYFVIGREGRLGDGKCPLNALENNSFDLTETDAAQLHMFRAFYYARSKDVTRGAPRIPVDDFIVLVPEEIHCEPLLEEAFLDVCFSDGAWELYQLKWAA